jgi:hypothetical protein
MKARTIFMVGATLFLLIAVPQYIAAKEATVTLEITGMT